MEKQKKKKKIAFNARIWWFITKWITTCLLWSYYSSFVFSFHCLQIICDDDECVWQPFFLPNVNIYMHEFWLFLSCIKWICEPKRSLAEGTKKKKEGKKQTRARNGQKKKKVKAAGRKKKRAATCCISEEH